MTSIAVNPRSLTDDIQAIEVEGEIDIHTAARVKEAVDRVVDAACRQVVLDLSGVTYIDSSGLVVLISTLKRMQEINGEVMFVCTHPHIVKIFDITGLSQVLKIFPTQEQALGGFASAQ